MIHPAQIFDMALSATGREPRAGWDGQEESPADYCRHKTDRAQLDRAWRYAQLLDLERCKEAMRQTKERER